MRTVAWLAVVLAVTGWTASLWVADATEHVGAAAAASEGLTSASSLSATQADAAAASESRQRSRGGFDYNKLYKPGSPGRGACCRICPNIFYAVPRLVPRPATPPPRFTAKQRREQRFAAIFDRREPPTAYGEDYSFIAFAEQHSQRQSQRQRQREQLPEDEYPPWPEHEYTADPYQDQPIPEFTPYAAMPGVNCCNICPAPGVGQLKWPDLLKWGESPATDDYPAPKWDIPCCKLCSAGCYSNGERRPPGVHQFGVDPNAPADPASATVPPLMTLLQSGDKVQRSNRTARAAVRNGQTVLSEVDARAGRRPRAVQMRGNWPKQMDPPGANKPLVPKVKSCASMQGCCQVCYNHPMIYDHAPEGIY